jgi:hypothetical protein
VTWTIEWVNDSRRQKINNYCKSWKRKKSWTAKVEAYISQSRIVALFFLLHWLARLHVSLQHNEARAYLLRTLQALNGVEPGLVVLAAIDLNLHLTTSKLPGVATSVWIQHSVTPPLHTFLNAAAFQWNDFDMLPGHILFLRSELRIAQAHAYFFIKYKCDSKIWEIAGEDTVGNGPSLRNLSFSHSALQKPTQ